MSTRSITTSSARLFEEEAPYPGFVKLALFIGGSAGLWFSLATVGALLRP